LLVGTPSQTVGPFFAIGLGGSAHGDVVDPATADTLKIVGIVRDGAGEPVPDALIELSQTEGCARAATTADGSFSFLTVKPEPVPGLDRVTQAPHIAVSVFARGLLSRLATRIYFPDEPAANAADPLLRELDDSSTLVARSEGDGLRFDITLQGQGETVFLDV
jgi:protocatechuate 3,4-dioxygenase, alpha subunit